MTKVELQRDSRGNEERTNDSCQLGKLFPFYSSYSFYSYFSSFVSGPSSSLLFNSPSFQCRLFTSTVDTHNWTKMTETYVHRRDEWLSRAAGAFLPFPCLLFSPSHLISYCRSVNLPSQASIPFHVHCQLDCLFPATSFPSQPQLPSHSLCVCGCLVDTRTPQTWGWNDSRKEALVTAGIPVGREPQDENEIKTRWGKSRERPNESWEGQYILSLEDELNHSEGQEGERFEGGVEEGKSPLDRSKFEHWTKVKWQEERQRRQISLIGGKNEGTATPN